MSLVKILSRHLTDITWETAATCDFTINNHVDLWRVSVSANLPLLTNFLATLRPEEIARANRYYRIGDRNTFIISRGATRDILGKYLSLQPSSIEFELGINKKPYVKNDQDLHFNISHSGDWILIGISNSEIGVDTELINKAFAYKEILPYNFSAREVDYINQDRSLSRFFMLWTRKEALIKATGEGLNDNLKLITCLDGIHFTQSNIISSANDWLINTFKLNENYLASIATNSKIDIIRFRDIYF
jgi:4'-phosphopantetheinyl transferase